MHLNWRQNLKFALGPSANKKKKKNFRAKSEQFPPLLDSASPRACTYRRKRNAQTALVPRRPGITAVLMSLADRNDRRLVGPCAESTVLKLRRHRDFSQDTAAGYVRTRRPLERICAPIPRRARRSHTRRATAVRESPGKTVRFSTSTTTSTITTITTTAIAFPFKGVLGIVVSIFVRRTCAESSVPDTNRLRSKYFFIANDHRLSATQSVKRPL